MSFEPEWKKNDRKTLKSGTRGAIYWVKESDKYASYVRDGALVSSKEPSRFMSGDSYAGEWLHNKKHGFGSMTWSNGNKYQGDWRNGKRDGTGTMWVFESGRLRKQYSGEWRENKRHGVGVYYDGSKNKYEGSWEYGLKEGRGKMFYSNGDVYEGEFVGDKRSGLGIQVYANGDQYEGHWLNDVKEGSGRYFYASTRKMLHSEWCNGVAKCGVFLDWPDGSGTGSFSLPECGLADASGVVSQCVKEARGSRAIRLGRDNLESKHESVFSDQELFDISSAFEAIDASRRGFVYGRDLGLVFAELDIYPCEQDLLHLLETCGATGDSAISQEQFVGLLACLRAPGNNSD